MLTLKELSSRRSENSKPSIMAYFPSILIRWRSHISTVKFWQKPRGLQNPFYARPMTSISSTGQKPDGSGFYSRQMPHYVELNRGQMPGVARGGGGMIALGID